MTDVLDLDAARAAVTDSSREPLPVKLGGKTYEVTQPLPIGAAIALGKGDLARAVNLMFGKKAQQVLDAGLDVVDLRLIADTLAGGPGE